MKGLLGAAIDAGVGAYPEKTAQQYKAADAVLLGAVGGENGILAVRGAPRKWSIKNSQRFRLYANVRPLSIWPSLDLSPLKPAYLDGVDLVVVRELTSDLYFASRGSV